MDDLLATIRAGCSPGALHESRAAAAAACRSVLAALGDASAPSPDAPAIGPPDIASILAALRGVPPDQLLDLAIARLRAALPANAAVTSTPNTFNVRLVPNVESLARAVKP